MSTWKMTTLATAAMFALAGTAGAANTMGKTEYKAEKERIAAEYKTAKENCKSMSDESKKQCLKDAKAQRAQSLSQAKQTYKQSAGSASEPSSGTSPQSRLTPDQQVPGTNPATGSQSN